MQITVLICDNDVILWNQGPWIFVYLYTRIAFDRRLILVVANTRTKLIQKQVKTKYPEEYSTVDKVGREKPLPSKSLIASSFLDLFSKQARLKASVRAFLFSIPYYRKLTLHEIKVLETNANLMENDFRIKKINAKEEVEFRNKGN